MPEPRTADAESQAVLGVTLVVLVVLLSLIGSVMILSASSVIAAEVGGSAFSVFLRQCAWLVVGFVGLYVGARIDYHRWTSLVPVLVIGSIALLGMVLVPGVGISVNGAQRWLGFGEFQLQPAEPAKFALVVYVAALVARERDRIHDLRVVLRPVLLVVVTMVGLLMLQPNLGTSAIICAVVGCMLLQGGLPLRVLSLLALAGAAIGMMAALAAPYRRARVTGFLDPWENAGDTGYQTIQSLIGVASGGVSGTGLGASRAKWGFLPEAHTDFVFAIIGEELGLIGALFVVGLFAVMIACALRIGARAHDRFGSMLATGVAAWFAVQGFVNVGAVLGILPITGVPLPFVSFGGSSLLSTMVAAGVLVNVAFQSRAPEHAVRERIAARRAGNGDRGSTGRTVRGR
ncbi:MAG: putative lipid II flippase FtsW [Acidimicrobiales bacterium]|nr:putative lipid II flippase FtsW [Acidimicrobiales bacterium]